MNTGKTGQAGSTKYHYDAHLAAVYGWMVGDFEQKQHQQEAYFRQHELIAGAGDRALDLGSGHGLQAVSLARLGYETTAVDFSADLLGELEQRSQGLSITVREGDITSIQQYMAGQQFSVVCCMGDTLPHLASVAQVKQLIVDVYELTKKNGRFVLSFRELTHAAVGATQCIPVKSERDRILTCILHFLADHVEVTDQLYTWQGEAWTQTVSTYRKLRLSEAQVTKWLVDAGWTMVSQSHNGGMVHLIAGKQTV